MIQEFVIIQLLKLYKSELVYIVYKVSVYILKYIYIYWLVYSNKIDGFY